MTFLKDASHYWLDQVNLVLSMDGETVAAEFLKVSLARSALDVSSIGHGRPFA